MCWSRRRMQCNRVQAPLRCRLCRKENHFFLLRNTPPPPPMRTCHPSTPSCVCFQSLICSLRPLSLSLSLCFTFRMSLFLSHPFSFLSCPQMLNSSSSPSATGSRKLSLTAVIVHKAPLSTPPQAVILYAGGCVVL